MKKLLQTIILTLGLIQTQAYAFEGNSSGGGGNSLNGIIVEDYIVSNNSEIEGYTEFIKTVSKIKKKAPIFAYLLEETFKNLTFYLVPTELNNLSDQQTKIPFDNEQTAIQIDGEVFINSNLFSKRPLETKGKLLLHEVIERTFFQTLSEDETIGDYIKNIRKITQILLTKASTLEEKDLLEELRNLYGVKAKALAKNIKFSMKSVLETRSDTKKYIDSNLAFIDKNVALTSKFCESINTDLKLAKRENQDALSKMELHRFRLYLLRNYWLNKYFGKWWYIDYIIHTDKFSSKVDRNNGIHPEVALNIIGLQYKDFLPLHTDDNASINAIKKSLELEWDDLKTQTIEETKSYYQSNLYMSVDFKFDASFEVTEKIAQNSLTYAKYISEFSPQENYNTVYLNCYVVNALKNLTSNAYNELSILKTYMK
ncbi:MAG: hypothetical protein AB7I27_01080 [Bacteriovoracaceae bacterium]